jgi:hypothetical protein
MDQKHKPVVFLGIVLMLLGTVLIGDTFLADRSQLDPQPISHPIDAPMNQDTSRRPVSVPILAIVGGLAWVVGIAMFTALGERLGPDGSAR